MTMGSQRPDRGLGPQPPVTAGRSEAAETPATRARLADLADSARAEALRKENQASVASARDLGGQERIAELKRRIAAKYYDRPEIKEQIADLLADDV